MTLPDHELVAEMRRLSSMWPRWMNDANFQQSQYFRQLIADAAKLAVKPERKLGEWRLKCRGKIGDFAVLRSEIETRVTDKP